MAAEAGEVEHQALRFDRDAVDAGGAAERERLGVLATAGGRADAVTAGSRGVAVVIAAVPLPRHAAGGIGLHGRAAHGGAGGIDDLDLEGARAGGGDLAAYPGTGGELDRVRDRKSTR